MTEQDKVFLQTGQVKEFAFDAQVANVFDDMVSRSVPFYNEIQRIQTDLIMDFLPETDAVVCDLGCSTGTTIDHLTKHPRCPPTAVFFGYDNSEPMLDKAHDKLKEEIATNKIHLILANINQLPQLPDCNVVILNWTLQFVRPIDRENLIKSVYTALKPGGILLLSEKVIFKDPLLNRLYIEHYLQFKISQSGYSETENQRKREALENVLIPYRIDENVTLLERSGFKHIDTFFQWFNFACFLAVKD